MQIPILSGIYSSTLSPELGIAMPVNMVPVVLDNGVSNGYMRPGDGIVQTGTLPGGGVDRGGIVWDGILYRVIGDKFCSVAAKGEITVIGTVHPGTTLCAFDYGYATLVGKEVVAYLGILSEGHLYYYDKSTLQEVTDPELSSDGPPIDLIWVDGYFMLTDGTYVYTTELTNPFEILPLSYGTTDVDPDPIVALIKFRNEVYVLNRHTIQILDNVGTAQGLQFAFAPVDGGQVTKGCVGTNACCVFESEIAFVGGGRNESPAVYFGANSRSQRISTIEVDRIIATYTDAELADAVLETRIEPNNSLLYLHLKDRTLVFDKAASAAAGRPAWSTLSSSLAGTSPYLARSMLWAYNQWNVGDPTSGRVGVLSQSTASHWGQDVRWEFSTAIFYNEGRGALFHELELVCLTGRYAPGLTPSISTSYSADGVTWSPSKSIKAGVRGNRTNRLVWLQQGILERMRIQRLQGDSTANLSVLRLEANIEPLVV